MSTTATREKPILFNSEMVKAILAGRKTQTRRVVKPQPASPPKLVDDILWRNERLFCIWPSNDKNDEGQHDDHFAACPYGKPGDRLWVREAWRVWASYDHVKPRDLPRDLVVQYEADGTDGPWRGDRFGKYRHARFMPRWASRITLEITDVRVERLHDISEADAQAEGCDGNCPVGHIPSHQAGPCSYHFAQLWESINGPDSWKANPWVWTISFKVL